MRARVYVGFIACLAVCSAASAAPAIVNFSGRVDGSGTVTVGSLAAAW